MRRGCALLLMIVLPSGVQTAALAEAPAEEEAPLVGRPVDLPFSGAIAGFAVIPPGPEYRVPFNVTAATSVSHLEAGTPLTLTVTVSATGNVRRPPERIDLRQAPGFAQGFFIEDITEGHREQIAPATWRWLYRLKPRSSEIDEVPGVPFVFYNPDLRPVEKAFQILYTDPIFIDVQAGEPLTSLQKLPEPLTSLALGAGVRKHISPGRPPGPLTLALLILAPPLACVCWYRLWQRRYPDRARQARMRRSGAARRALRTLQASPSRPGPARGDWITGAVATYLGERFDWGIAEPTGQEAMNLLLAHGCSLELAEQVGLLLRACAAARFPPTPLEEVDLVEQATAFILAAEERA